MRRSAAVTSARRAIASSSGTGILSMMSQLDFSQVQVTVMKYR
jgi:hypothetical protein